MGELTKEGYQKDTFFDEDELTQLVNSLGSGIGGLCCVYVKDVENFSDLSEEIDIKFIE